MAPLYCRRTISILVTSLFLWHVETGDVLGDVSAQMSINNNCSWNYTKKNSDGFELYKVFVTPINYTTYYIESRTARPPKFEITLLGEEYDARRQLYIRWAAFELDHPEMLSFGLGLSNLLISETSHQSNVISVSSADLVDKHSARRYEEFNFQIEKIRHTPTRRKFRLGFDCIEISRGLNLSVNVCDVNIHNRRQGRPTCNAKVIDTIRCSCNDTSINVTEHSNIRNEKMINIVYSNMSPGMRMSVEVIEEETFTKVYGSERMTLVSNEDSIRIPLGKLPPSNYTVTVTLYCRDYSEARVDQVCQSQKFYFQIKPTQVSQVLHSKHPVKCGPIQKSCRHVFGFGGFTIFLVIVIVVCFIYVFKRRRDILALLTTRSGRSFDSVSQDSPSRPLNSYSLNNTSYTRPLQNNSSGSANTNSPLEIPSHQISTLLSHHTPSDTNALETERKVVENLKSNGVTVTYSWIDRQTAVLNWEQLSNNIANYSTNIILFLSKSLLDLLELSAKDGKTFTESKQLKNLLCDRNYENIPYVTLKTLRSDFLRQVGGRKPEIHFICTCTTHGEIETSFVRMSKLYPEFKPDCKVYCLKCTVDTFVTSNLIVSRDLSDSGSRIPLILSGFDLKQVDIQRLKVA